MTFITFVFEKGQFNNALSDLSALPSGVHFEHQDNVTLVIPQNLSISNPLHFIYLDGCEGLRNTIILDENSSVTMVEEYTSKNATNYETKVSLKLNLKRNASLQYYRLQNENHGSCYEANLQVEQQESSQSKMFFADWGGKNSASTVKVALAGSNASCSMHGVYYLKHDNQMLDNQFFVDHCAERSTSEMVIKGVLDKKSKAKFLGKVHVYESGQRSQANQQNHHLLLSPDAEVSAKPELEIYADDIKCAHGATVGQPDNDTLFYLRSRCIDESSALTMLTEAFVAEIMEKIENKSVKTYIQERVGQHEFI